MSLVLVSKEGGVLRATLNGPDQRNLIGPAFLDAIEQALVEAEGADDVRAVLMDTSATAFCSGWDPSADSGELEHRAARLFGRPMEKPLVAAVHGTVFGPGIGLLCMAHLVVAAHETRFACDDIRHGFPPKGVHGALTRAIGMRAATDLAMTGRLFSVNDALRFGLVSEIAPLFEYDERAEAIARHVASLDSTLVTSLLRSRFMEGRIQA
jgi:enoyl-CoA hydratase/carnithine racemase